MPKTTVGYIVNEGMGGYLDPPGYPTHSYSVWEGPRRNPHSMSSIESAIRETYYSQEVKDRAVSLIQAWKDNRPELASPEVQAWIADCYRHWARCWYSEIPVRYGSHCACEVGDGPQPEGSIDYAEYHVKRFYPEFVPK